MKSQAESAVIARSARSILAQLAATPESWYAAMVVESSGLCPELSAVMADIQASIALADGTIIRGFGSGDDDDEDY